MVDGKVVTGASYEGKARVHLHKVRAHTGVRGNEVADAFAKNACRSPEDTRVQVALGKGVVKRDFSFRVTPVGGPGRILETSRKLSGNIYRRCCMGRKKVRTGLVFRTGQRRPGQTARRHFGGPEPSKSSARTS